MAILQPRVVVNDCYILQSRVGEDSFTEHWVATAIFSATRFILRFLKQGLSAREQAERLRAEALACYRVSGPGIADFIEIEDFDGRSFVASEYHGETTLREAIRSGEAWPLDQVCAMALRLARALQSFHAQGLVYGNLTAENVRADRIRRGVSLVAAQKPSMLTLIPYLPPLEPNDPDSLERYAYLAPELNGGTAPVADLDPSCDVYSIGIHLVRFIAGRLPYPDLSAAPHGATPTHGASRRFVTNALFRRGVPEAFVRIALRCCMEDPAGRYPTCQPLIEDLERFLSLANASDRLEGSSYFQSLGSPRSTREGGDIATFPQAQVFPVALVDGFAGHERDEADELVVSREELAWGVDDFLAFGRRSLGLAIPVEATKGRPPVGDESFEEPVIEASAPILPVPVPIGAGTTETKTPTFLNLYQTLEMASERRLETDQVNLEDRRAETSLSREDLEAPNDDPGFPTGGSNWPDDTKKPRRDTSRWPRDETTRVLSENDPSLSETIESDSDLTMTDVSGSDSETARAEPGTAIEVTAATDMSDAEPALPRLEPAPPRAKRRGKRSATTARGDMQQTVPEKASREKIARAQGERRTWAYTRVLLTDVRAIVAMSARRAKSGKGSFRYIQEPGSGYASSGVFDSLESLAGDGFYVNAGSCARYGTAGVEEVAKMLRVGIARALGREGERSRSILARRVAREDRFCLLSPPEGKSARRDGRSGTAPDAEPSTVHSDEALSSFARSVCSLGRRNKPLVLVLRGGDRIDGDAHRFFSYLAREAESRPACVVVFFERVAFPPWHVLSSLPNLH